MIGLAWLILHWRLAVLTFSLALLPAVWLVRRWRRSQHKAKALFDFTLAESLRNQVHRHADEHSAATCESKSVAHQTQRRVAASSGSMHSLTRLMSPRRQGETKASVRKYDEILKLTCPEQLVWVSQA